MCNLVITELEGELSSVSSYFHKEVGGDWRLPSSFLLPHLRIPVFLTFFLFWPRFYPIVVLSFFSLFSLLLLLLPLRCFVAFSSPCSSHSSSQISSFFFLPVFFCITIIMLISFVSYVCPCFPSDFLPCSLPAFFLILFHCPPTLPYSQGGAWNWFQFLAPMPSCALSCLKCLEAIRKEKLFDFRMAFDGISAILLPCRHTAPNQASTGQLSPLQHRQCAKLCNYSLPVSSLCFSLFLSFSNLYLLFTLTFPFVPKVLPFCHVLNIFCYFSLVAYVGCASADVRLSVWGQDDVRLGVNVMVKECEVGWM